MIPHERHVVRRFTVVLTIVLLLAPVAALGADEAKEKAAQAAAEAWLALLDAGKYGESWDQASALFRDKLPRPRWEQMAASVRQKYGAVESRTLKLAEYTTELPNAPEGEYVVLQFDAKYANKADAVETVTPMLESDGQWRVSGFFIR